MQWTKDATGDQYTLQMGDCQAIVRRATEGAWTTLIEREGIVTEHGSYKTIQEAQAWCLGRLAELAAEGQCGGEAKV